MSLESLNFPVKKLLEDAGLDIELIEQPVIRHDFEGLKYVTDHTYTPIMADEAVFSPDDMKRVLEMRAADLVNLKLMKSGGIYKALQMNKMAAPHRRGAYRQASCAWRLETGVRRAG